MLRYLWGWLCGYVVITVFGKNKEQFLNLALQRNIDIYDIEYKEAAEPLVIAKVSCGDLRFLRTVSRKTGCRFKIGRRYGLPFFCKYLKKRKMLVLGMALFCVGLYVLSGFVWFIEVTPREQVKYLDENEIIALGEQYGIKKGVWGRNLDFDSIQKQMLTDIPELSWIAVERRGILINYNVAERDVWTEEENNATMGAIWANRKALIEEILIKHGTAAAETGQLVQKGDLLVSPLADGRADAIIRGRVWYEGYGECALKEVSQKPDGAAKKYVYLLRSNADGVDPSFLRLWGLGDWNTDEAGSNGENLLIKTTKAQPCFFGRLTLPITFLVKEITPAKQVVREYTEEEAKSKALAEARKSLRQQIGENNTLIEEKTDYKLQDGVCRITVKWECKEEIGMRNTEQTAD